MSFGGVKVYARLDGREKEERGTRERKKDVVDRFRPRLHEQSSCKRGLNLRGLATLKRKISPGEDPRTPT